MDNEKRIRQMIANVLHSYRIDHHKTQEEMADILFDYQISQSAYYRAERGSNDITIIKLINILDALNIDISAISFSNTAVFVSRNVSDDRTGLFRNLIGQFFYSSKFATDISLEYRKLFFLFVLYLPLIPPAVLEDILLRIGGSIIDQEDYFFQQIQWAIQSAPDSAAKVFADRIAEQILSLSSDDTVRFYETKDRYYMEDLSRLKEGLFHDEYRSYRDAIHQRFDLNKLIWGYR